MAVQTIQKEQPARAVTTQGARLGRTELVNEFMQMMPLRDHAEKAAVNQLLAHTKLFSEARRMIADAKQRVREGAKYRNIQVGDDPDLLDAVTKIAQAAWKLEPHDLDRAARINCIMGNFCAKIGDHAYAAGFFFDAAMEKAKAAKVLKEHAAALNDQPGKRRAQRLDEAHALFGTAVEHYAEYYDSAAPGGLDTKKPAATVAVSVFKEAYRMVYQDSTEPDVEKRRDAARVKMRGMYEKVFDMTTCFPDLRGELLAIWACPWQAYHE